MGPVQTITPRYQRIRDDRRLWRLCGFTEVPAYQTTWERFAELEQFAPAFEEAAGKVIRRARRHDPEVGAWLHGDGTECETHAAPVHDCRDDEHCPTRGHRNRNERRRLRRLPTESATAIRHAKTELAEEEEDGVVTVDRAQPAPVERVGVDRARGGVRFYAGGHWWYSRDPDAGTRAYTLNGRTLRAWHGFYHHKLIDHYTGCPVTVLIHSAAESEAVAYPRLLERAIENTGLVPAAVTLDRGFATRAIYRLRSKMGVGTIAPYRRLSPHDPEQAAGTDAYDEHGVPRCRHCGGETAFVRFAHEPRPRLWVRCPLPSTDGCAREQTISCSHEWRRLIPIWRTTPVYAALRGWHQTTEQVHRAWRDRYRSWPKSLAQRPKRIGVGVHQLRASAALLVEWLRLSFRGSCDSSVAGQVASRG